ncbi:MAG: AAA family ATPase [Nitrososphaerales archaeon]|nr:AAA family ATPase [Nitrososphaerales archaeon]
MPNDRTRRLERVIGITGTPGTGKKTVGRLLARFLNFDFLDLNQLAIEKGAIMGEDEHGFIADTDLLRKHARESVKGKRVVAVGHLLSSIFSKRRIELVVVLRCSPLELENRYRSRNYGAEKVKENMASEILGICAYDALKKFGRERVAEFDTTGRDAHSVVEDIIKVIKGEYPKRAGFVDWLQHLHAEQLNRFFG